MMTEGLLATDTPDPLNATYRRGFRASHFTSPESLASKSFHSSSANADHPQVGISGLRGSSEWLRVEVEACG
jgi:hypothetical protein